MAGAPPHPIHPSTSPNLNIHPQLRHPRIPPPTQYPSNWRPANFDEYNEWNHSPLGLFPSVLIGPGLNPDPLPRPQPERPPNTGVASTNNTGAASADNTHVAPTNNSRKRKQESIPSKMTLWRCARCLHPPVMRREGPLHSLCLICTSVSFVWYLMAF